MSYEVHIHRAEDHFDAAENPIPREDWEDWVTNAPDFRFSESDYVTFEYEDGERQNGSQSGRSILRVRSSRSTTTTGRS
jgi:hypothetical protein